jgi:hypothetical protein
MKAQMGANVEMWLLYIISYAFHWQNKEKNKNIPQEK